tara:strand:- start:808 stop:1326 length:519 start_codon:yes stop_codon:yes gene_type:complete
MVVSIFGYFFLFLGFLILVLPLMLVELSRPRDWLIGGLFLFLGLFLLVERDLLKDSIHLLLVCTTILYVKMILEIIQTRWYQLSSEEKKRIGSFRRWFESFKQLAQSFVLLVKSFLNFIKIFKIKPEKPLKEKKWVHPEFKKEVTKNVVGLSSSIDSNKIRNQELTENEETS